MLCSTECRLYHPGKTTALIYKIRAVDQENATKEDHQPVRQMFVTRSRVLAQHVESTYQGLSEFTNIAHKSEAELREMAKQSREDPDRALVEFDTEVDVRADLPSRYSDLRHSHFPLFISFDKVGLVNLSPWLLSLLISIASCVCYLKAISVIQFPDRSAQSQSAPLLDLSTLSTISLISLIRFVTRLQ
jgi:hypothetical protein